MADLRISELTQRTPDGTEYFEVIIPPFTPGTNRKVLLSDLAYVFGGVYFRGAHNASGNTYPAAGSGSGTAGAIQAGDTYYFSVAATSLDGGAWPISTIAIALVNTPGQTTTNWRLI